MPISNPDELWDSGWEWSLITFPVSKSESRIIPSNAVRVIAAFSSWSNAQLHVHHKRNAKLELHSEIMGLIEGSDVTWSFLNKRMRSRIAQLWYSATFLCTSITRAWNAQLEMKWNLSVIPDCRWHREHLLYPSPTQGEGVFAKRWIIFKRNLIYITKAGPLITLASQFQSTVWNSRLLPFPPHFLFRT